MKKYLIPTLILVLSFSLFGCHINAELIPTTQTTTSQTTASQTTIWNEEEAPNYYLVTGEAEVIDQPANGQINLSELDSLGRTGEAVATITYQMYSDSVGWREEIPTSENPTGWGNNVKASITLPDGGTYTGWFWNRSHLIADSLGGHAVKQNLITGTRMQNVGANKTGLEGGMAYTETKARNWIKTHTTGTIYYRVTPVYLDNELIPRSVIVNICTSDKSINERVIVYNSAKNYNIDYTTGTVRKIN